MLQGTDTLWGMWLSFFGRIAPPSSSHRAAAVGIWINWRLGLVLVALIIVFGITNAFVLRRTEAPAAAGGRPSCQSRRTCLRTRWAMWPGAELHPHRGGGERTEGYGHAGFGGADSRALVVGAGFHGHEGATSAHHLAILLIGTWLYLHGLAAMAISSPMWGFATMLIGRLDHTVSFVEPVVMSAPGLAQFFEVLVTVGQVRDSPGAGELRW